MQSIGEHLKSEASSAVELGVLSKKLNQESKISLVSSILMMCWGGVICIV